MQMSWLFLQPDGEDEHHADERGAGGGNLLVPGRGVVLVFVCRGDRVGGVGRVGGGRGGLRAAGVGLADGGEGDVAGDPPPSALGGGGTGARGDVLGVVVGLLDAGGLDGLPLGLEVLEVGALGGRGALAGEAVKDLVVVLGHVVELGPVGDDAVVVLLLDPLVHNHAAPVANHVLAKDGVHVVPQPRPGDVAARLAEEDGHGELGGVLLELVVAGLGVGAGVAPRVRVEGEEVDNLRGVAAARQVVLEHGAELLNVGGRVADGDAAVALAVAVGLHVAGGGLEVGRGGGVFLLGDVFVADEES